MYKTHDKVMEEVPPSYILQKLLFSSTDSTT